MRILYLTSSTDTKVGWGRYARDLIEGIRERGHTVTVVTDNNAENGIPLIRSGLGVFASAFALKKYAAEADIIHALDVNPYGIVANLSKAVGGKRAPLIISAQGTYAIAPLHNVKTSYLSRQAYRNADAIIAISNYTAGELIKSGITAAVEVIPHGIDLTKFIQKHADSKEPFILSVGALKRRKGYHVSIPAFAKVREKIPGLRYKIIGTGVGEYPNELRRLAKEHGVADAIDFLGVVGEEKLLELYRKALAFMLLSVNEGNHFEGFGLVFLEAAAAGVPVLGTTGNGIEDAVANRKNGILVPQNDIDSAADALLSILSDPKRWLSMSKHGVTWAKAHTLEGVIEAYESVYREVRGL